MRCLDRGDVDVAGERGSRGFGGVVDGGEFHSTEAGRDPRDKGLSDLIGELCTRSEDFHTRWAAHDVRLHRTGVKCFRHPVVGELTLNFEAMQLTTDTSLTLTAYTAQPDSPSAESLRLLASWAATELTTAPGKQ
ncbi:hypothetical protein [Saccharopolyspora spinosa]|uniref:MmyB family transcriptional regulator n=1 Tax=Saccharopolyspora spinosa TaxID=60894 RepID=UPI00192B9A44|nr:hypothetical protein [Saccharopolyspora spinosa]